MNNDNNNLFNSIENHIDAKAGNPLSGQIPSHNEEGAEFLKELAVREELQTIWNRSRTFEDIKSQINKIHRQGKKQYQPIRYLSYAAAACLMILLAIPGYQYFVKQNSRTLEMNETEIKSTLIYFDKGYKQISPINGQFFDKESILFEWYTALDIKTNLVITDKEAGKIVFMRPINTKDMQYRFNQYIGKGEYSWRLEGFEGEIILIMR